MKGELHTDCGSIAVFICPEKDNAKELKDIDVILVKLTNARKQEMKFHCTPDEALEISSVLSSSVGAWLNFKYAPYQKKFNKRRNQLNKKFKVNLK